MGYFQAAEKADHKLSKEDYKEQVPDLRIRLLQMQELLKRADFPVMVLISGVDGAGKGELVNRLNEWMDPRYLQTFAFGPKTDEECERPEFWRFWRSLPAKGQLGVYMGSWYSDPISLRLKGLINRKEWLHQLGRGCRFEKLLTDDGVLVIKIWMHLGKQDQIDRMEKLSSDPVTAWRVTDFEREHLRVYDRFRELASETLELTSRDNAPWQVVYGKDEHYREITIAEEICRQVEERLEGKGRCVSVDTLEKEAGEVFEEYDRKAPKLKKLDLSASLDKKQYKAELAFQQSRLNSLSREAWRRGISTVMALEGWDAAGKGGIIRRIVPAMDARHCRILPIAAPSSLEHRYHYLWRFWQHIPRAGNTTIFDRTWYGRVLVERIEGYAKGHEWKRAYKEICDFESQLVEHGIVLMKYWLHISKEEQLERFQLREVTPHKKFKITEEDYRNRERWDEYEEAVEDMVARTHQPDSPWLLIEGNDKRYARVKAITSYCDRLEAAIESNIINL
ncbi:MAG: polyphosphate:AMP phosphotransferase [Motiliproteus sp.]|nr:polyphosphate:AMP phosphotransferase [Motiliproteus sp.]